MANNFKKLIDRQVWVQIAPSPNAHAAGGGMASDLRNDLSRNPHAWQLVSNAVLNRYNFNAKSWQLHINPGLGGTFGAGAGCIFAPSFSLVGAIGAGCTTTSIVTTTAITAVGVNSLGAKAAGESYAYRVRITGNSAGGSGKTEERWIIGNTGGTTPTLLLDSALSFTPANGDAYEILCGKVYMLGAGTLAAASWRSFEIATATLASLSNTNLPGTVSTDFAAVALDELYVPYDHIPGEGFVVGASTYDGTSKRCLLATGIAVGSITGQAAAGDAGVLANEYRNFQVRIVEDTGTPTAVGQRRIIASHTAGASPVYTLGSNWSVTPSANAKFVIEYPNLILLRSSATTSVYTYNYTSGTVNNGTNSIASNAWSTAYFGVAGNAMGAGCILIPSFGIQPDAAKNARHSNIFCFRGGASASLDLLDIAGAITGTWSAAVAFDGSAPAISFTTGTCGVYAPADQEGSYGYINCYVASAVNQIWRFDVKTRCLTSFTPTDWIQAGTAAVGHRMASCVAIDGSDHYTVLLLLSHLAANAMELIVQT